MPENLSKQLATIELAEKKLAFKKMRTMEKALKSDSPDDMVKVNQMLTDIQPKVNNDPKAFLIDPLEFNSAVGFKDKPYSLSYVTLRRMAKTPIINAIIKTRKNQVADFVEPQADRYSTGFVIRKKAKNGVESKMSNADKKIANAITDFILNCGGNSSWASDDFDTFTRKVIDDSLTLDQMTWENIRNRRGKLETFMATDAATMRMADSFYADDYDNKYFKRNGVWRQSQDFGEKVKGYYPSYVQIYQNAVVNEFYPWELCFGVRNPSTSIHANGYGLSELEELINVVTSMLWGDEYNRRFFSQGSAPKGLLRVKGQVNETALQQFKQQWQAMITGVMQSWKTPVVEGDIDWIDLQKNNRDMEYTSWMEYLIKLSCGIYSIDPSEIGWDISRSAGNGGMFEGGQKERLKNSKDKGLYPLLKFYQRKLNKYVVEQLNPEFEFVFMGLNGTTIEEELDMDIKKAGSFQTVNEIREKWDLKDLGEDGDIINNSVFMQAKNAKAQQNMNMQNGMQGGQPGQQPESENPFDLYADEQNPFEEDYDQETEKAENNLFVKAFDNFLKIEQNG